jgi:pyruvate/2-oxoacid:ferredoxin oxidoreductase beta subunit
MSYLDVIAESPDLVTPGCSACQGCAAELIIRRVLQIAGQDTIACIPPGCLAGAGAIGWNFDMGLKVPVHITLLDNTASFLSGVSNVYRRRGRPEVNMVALAGDGATADCGFQSLSGAAERRERLLYVCYDNECYANTGFQRSSTTSQGSKTSTTPAGSLSGGKSQSAKYLPFIMAMHQAEYVATVSPSHMRDFVTKIQKALEASKRGFAYVHAFSPCPTGWQHPAEEGIEIARLAVRSHLFPLFEADRGVWRQTVSVANPVPVSDYASRLGKFAHFGAGDIGALQAQADLRLDTVRRMSAA